MSANDRHDVPKGKGFRHVALRVSDLAVSKAFYQTWFHMEVVWEPDAESVYLSSGADNVALHRIPEGDRQEYRSGHGQVLDHLGFVMDSPQRVDLLYALAVKQGVPIVHPPRQHRDGSYSFYLADPDRIVIQILYEPTISGREAG